MIKNRMNVSQQLRAFTCTIDEISNPSILDENLDLVKTDKESVKKITDFLSSESNNFYRPKDKTLNTTLDTMKKIVDFIIKEDLF